MREPFVSAAGVVRVVALHLVRLEDEGGHVGYGEEVGSGDLRAAHDLARLDLEGRRSGQPAWQLLGATGPPPLVEVNATIATAEPAGAGRAAAAARAAGFGCVKVKVGHGDDLARLEAVRSNAGDEMAIRIDANGAWSATEAVRTLRELEPLGIECCEEPCSGLDAIARVAAAVPVPIALDESSALPGALERRVCHAVCLKIARCGGATALVAAAAQARAAGYEVYLASMLDGPLGIAAALHTAAVVKPDRPCGLATLGLFDGREDPIPVRDSRMAVPHGPGMGDGLLAWYGLSDVSVG